MSESGDGFRPLLPAPHDNEIGSMDFGEGASSSYPSQPTPTSPISSLFAGIVPSIESSDHNAARRPKAPTLREADWAPVKDRIIELHIELDIPLSEVSEIILREFGFSATARQYRSRISTWGLDKNVKSAEMNFILRKQAQRQVSEPHKPPYRFRVRGKIVNRGKIRRFAERSRSNSVVTDVNPDTPEDLTYSTGSGSPTASVRSGAASTTIGADAVGVHSPAMRSYASSPALSVITFEQQSRPTLQGQTPRFAHKDPVWYPPQALGVLQPGSDWPLEVELRHRLACLEQPEGGHNLELIEVLEALWQLNHRQAKYSSAESFARRLVTVSREMNGDNNEATINAVMSLGSILSCQGLGEQAEKFQRRAFQLSQAALGLENQCTLRCMAELSSTLLWRGREEEANVLCSYAHDICRSLLGESHALTIRNLFTLATINYARGRLNEAEALYLQILGIEDAAVGQDGNSVDQLTIASSMARLVNLYLSCGQHQRARDCGTKGLRMCRQLWGAEHPITLWLMRLMARVALSEGSTDEAERLCTDAHKGSTRVLGKEHPDTMNAARVAAQIQLLRGNYAAAETLAREVSNAYKRQLGPEHPDTLCSMSLLALIWKTKGSIHEAAKLQEECCHIWQRVRAGHPWAIREQGRLDAWIAEMQ